MEKVDTLYHINLSVEEKQLASSIINTFGTGQHPYASTENVHAFARTYLLDIINSDEFKPHMEALTGEKKKLLLDLKEKL